MKLVLIGSLLAAVATQSKAQNTVLRVQQDLHFKLTGYYQASPTETPKTLNRNADKVTISNNDIINMLEGQVGIIFSGDARILLISLVPVDPAPRVVIRDKFEGEKFDTDVTEYFSARVLASIEDTKINKNPLKAKGSSYDVYAFEINVPQASLKLQGFEKMKVITGKSETEPVAIVHTGKVETTGGGVYQVSAISGVVPLAVTGTIEVSGSEVKASVE
jgi:hypothetical protein